MSGAAPDPSEPLSPVSEALLHELASAPREGGTSVPRLGKRLGLGASAVMRQLTLMSDAMLGGTPGPGWVRVVQIDDRWVAHLTDAGRARVEARPSQTEAN